jgi:TonB family protein
MRSGRAAESGRERAALRRVKSWLAVRRDIDLVLAPGIIEPGVWRIFRPVIVLPENISDHLSERELESVIMHELIHIERRDNLTATLQMILCAVFWFHPLVWMIDRKMLADRERACDEEVCRLGGQSGVYAASLLKVLQLCIGLKMAGVSSAAGSNLRRRIEEIMHNDTEKKSSAMHHALVGLLAFAVIAFTLASGLMSRDRVLAEQKVKERSSSVQGGVTGGVPGGVPGGVIDGVFGIAAVETQSGSVYRGEWQVRDLIDELKQAPDIPLQFDNDHQPPVTITEARMKAVRNLSVYKKQGEEWLPVADLYAVKPILLLTNNSAQRVSGYTLEFSGEDGSRSLHYTKAISPIEPNASFSIGEDWKRFISLYGDPSSFSVKVVRVLFDDGDSWGKMLPPPPPPPPPPPVYSSGRDVPPPPPVPVEGAKPPKVIRKSGGVLQGEAIRRAVPSYPEQAKEARVSGAVVVEITIDEEGNVINAQALSGHPMLRDAAIEAARQWKFAPTTLQEQPVKVIGTLTFNFTP